MKCQLLGALRVRGVTGRDIGNAFLFYCGNFRRCTYEAPLETLFLNSDGGGDLAVGFVADEVEVFVGDGQQTFEAAELVFRVVDF